MKNFINQTVNKKLSGKLFFFLLFVFICILGLGKINLKNYGIPLSFGGNPEKLILWPLLFGIIYGFDKLKFLYRDYKIPLITFALLTAWTFIANMTFSPSKEGSEYFMTFVSGLICFFLMIISFAKERFYETIISALIISGIFAAIIGLLNHNVYSDANFIITNTNVQRISTPVGHPNFLGIFIMLIFPFALLRFLENPGNIKSVILYLITNMLLLSGIILSYSRTTWIGFGIGIIVFFGLYSKRSIKYMIIPVVLLPLFLSVFDLKKDFGINNSVIARAESILNLQDDSNLIERIYCWKATFRIIAENPVFGIGPGNERFENKFKEKKELSSRLLMPHPHNIFLHMAVMFGIPGLIFFLILLFSGVKNALIKINDKESNYIIPALASIAGLIVCGFFESPMLADRVVPIIWIIISLLLIPKFNPNYE